MTGAAPVFTLTAALWAGLSLPALIAGLAKWDPLERTGGAGIGPRVNAQWGWFVMELPALLTFPLIYFLSPHSHPVGNLVVVLWLLHYSHRTLLWPWLVQRRNSTMPLIAGVAGFLFNGINGGFWGWFMGYVVDYPAGWLTGPLFITGTALALAGAALNVWSDYRLKDLRKNSRNRYVIPRGGPFEFVSGPQFLGEIIEWFGFALLTWSLPGLAFALWTTANLVPRALWRHAWYRETFENYPRKRRALFPGLL